jgi:2-methylcitrate dehydratase PrpD
VLKISSDQAREALGIAEYFGPRSQMMRVVDQPTMVKDSSSWGAMTGVTAAYLAAAGFTGAPAVTIEAADMADVWSDLGRRWLITEQYFKLWPVCRWAQPAVAAALAISDTRQIDHRRIRRVVITTFHEARRLAGHAPQNTDQAQYAIAFPTACAFVRGRAGVDEVAGTGLQDADVRALAQRIVLDEAPEFNAAFPNRRLARLLVELDDGRTFESPVTEPPGDPDQPLADTLLFDKFFAFAAPVLGQERTMAIRRAIGPFDQRNFDLPELLSILRQPL